LILWKSILRQDDWPTSPCCFRPIDKVLHCQVILVKNKIMSLTNPGLISLFFHHMLYVEQFAQTTGVQALIIICLRWRLNWTTYIYEYFLVNIIFILLFLFQGRPQNWIWNAQKNTLWASSDQLWHFYYHNIWLFVTQNWVPSISSVLGLVALN